MSEVPLDPPANPYEALGLLPRFDLDDAQLHRQFVHKAAAAHPDRFTDPFDQTQAAQQAAWINDAYHTLRDPHARAEALLLLLGGPTKEQDKSVPPDLLSQMMQVRLQLEEAIEEDDPATLNELSEWAYHQRRQHLDKIAELFQAVTCASSSPTAASPRSAPTSTTRSNPLTQIRLELNTMRYIQRMIEQLPARHTHAE